MLWVILMKKLGFMFTIGAFLHPTQITNENLDKGNYHFYIIASSTIKHFDGSYLKDNQIVFKVTDNSEVKEFAMPNPDKCKVISYDFKYTDPSQENIIASFEVDNNGKIEKYSNVTYSASELWHLFSYERNFQIEYIGQTGSIFTLGQYNKEVK